MVGGGSGAVGGTCSFRALLTSAAISHSSALLPSLCGCQAWWGWGWGGIPAGHCPSLSLIDGGEKQEAPSRCSTKTLSELPQSSSWNPAGATRPTPPSSSLCVCLHNHQLTSCCPGAAAEAPAWLRVLNLRTWERGEQQLLQSLIYCRATQETRPGF